MAMSLSMLPTNQKGSQLEQGLSLCSYQPTPKKQICTIGTESTLQEKNYKTNNFFPYTVLPHVSSTNDAKVCFYHFT